MTKVLQFNAGSLTIDEIDVTEGGGSSGASSLMNCPASVAVGDAVYVASAADNTADKAFAGAVGRTPEAVGIVISKPTSTTAQVLPVGLTGNIFAGLVRGARYFLSATAAGGIVTPSPSGPGVLSQAIGRAVSATNLFVALENSPVLRGS